MWAIYLFSEQLVLQDKVKQKKEAAGVVSSQCIRSRGLDPAAGDPDPALSISLFYFGERSFQSFHQKHEYW